MKLLEKAIEVKQRVNKVKQQIGFGTTLFKLVGNPNDTTLVFKLEEKLSKAALPEATAKAMEYLKQNSVIRQMLEERYLAPDYKVEDLAICQPGTLGYAYYRHMTDNGFSPDFYPKIDPVDDYSYYALRLRQTHDIWHVVTGYSPSSVDEIGLQAFYAAQGANPFNISLIASGLLHSALVDRSLMTPMLEAVRIGAENGKAARLIHAVKWEEMWNRSLEDIRREYNVTPAYSLYDFAPEPSVEERELALA